MADPNWLRWAKELHAVAQIGLTYSDDNHFDRDRYQRVMEIAAEIMATSGNLDAAAALDLWGSEREHGYLTPKVDVRALVFDADERILLVREKADGKWSTPGGWADVNESASRVVVREVWEEATLRVEAVKLIGLLDRSDQGHVPPFPFHVYKALFLCRLAPGLEQSPIAGDETLDASFFAENELPALSLGRVLPQQIARAYVHLRDPGLAADFD